MPCRKAEKADPQIERAYLKVIAEAPDVVAKAVAG